VNGPQIRNEQLATLAMQVEGARRHAQTCVAGLSPAQLAWQPGTKAWGVAQCIEHLVLTLEATELQVPGKIAEARANGAGATPAYEAWKPGWIGGFLINGTKPGSRPVRTNPKFVPVTTRPEILQRFMEKTDAFVGWMRSADGLDLTRIRIRSPFLSLLTYHLGDCFTINTVHLERHLQQADRVKAREGFPKG